LELPPVSMAKDTTGVVSGVAYRLMLSPLLAKVGRLERSMVPNVIKAVKIALAYQGTPVEKVCVEVQDAMPVIPLEEAQRVALLASSAIFAGSAGTKYLLEQAGVPSDIAEKIAGTAMAENPGMEMVEQMPEKGTMPDKMTNGQNMMEEGDMNGSEEEGEERRMQEVS
jgi:hypothetical protein